MSYDEFKGCTSLTSVTFPEALVSVGYGAFEDCTSPAEINIPAMVKDFDSGDIRNTAFYNDESNW